MELYISSSTLGRQACPPLITKVAAIALDDQGSEIAVFETALEDLGSALMTFLDRYPRAVLHAADAGVSQALFLSAAPDLLSRTWGECVITAALEVMERLDVERSHNAGRPIVILEDVAHCFGIPVESGGNLAAARLLGRLHAVVKDRRVACDVEEDEATHMMEQGL